MLRTLGIPASVALVVPASLPSCSLKPDCGLLSVTLTSTGISSVDKKKSGAECTSLSLLNHVYKDGVITKKSIMQLNCHDSGSQDLIYLQCSMCMCTIMYM